jgi:serine/threonine protein kinase
MMLTKKKIATKRKNTTRKIPPFEKLPKTRRARILSMETYKINCGKNNLYGYKSFTQLRIEDAQSATPLSFITADKVGSYNVQWCKAAEETSMHKDDFVHVILSKLQDYDKPVVVKVYDANKLHLLLEKKILEKIRGYRNTARLICEFSCDDNKNNYITKLTKQIKFCERGTNKLYFFVYEYIAHGDISDYLKKTRDVQIIKTLILQVVCVIIELATIYKVCHGDLNSGNILINTTDEKTLEYRIGDEIVVIESNGIIPIIIDFGRSKFYRESINYQDVWYDIIIIVNLINTYVKNYDVDLAIIKNQDPYELDLPSINDYYYYVRDALYAPGYDQ